MLKAGWEGMYNWCIFLTNLYQAFLIFPPQYYWVYSSLIRFYTMNAQYSHQEAAADHDLPVVGEWELQGHGKDSGYWYKIPISKVCIIFLKYFLFLNNNIFIEAQNLHCHMHWTMNHALLHTECYLICKILSLSTELQLHKCSQLV